MLSHLRFGTKMRTATKIMVQMCFEFRIKRGKGRKYNIKLLKNYNVKDLGLT